MGGDQQIKKDKPSLKQQTTLSRFRSHFGPSRLFSPCCSRASMPPKRRTTGDQRRNAVAKAKALYSCATQAGDHAVALQAFAKMAMCRQKVAGNTKWRKKAIAAAAAAGEAVRSSDASASSSSYGKLADSMESPSKGRCDEIRSSFVPIASTPGQPAYLLPYPAPSQRPSDPEPRGSVGEQLRGSRPVTVQPRGSVAPGAVADLPFKAPPPKQFEVLPKTPMAPRVLGPSSKYGGSSSTNRYVG